MVVALMGAVKVLQLVRAREGHTDQSLSAVFHEPEREFLQRLNGTLEGKTEKQKNPHPPRSLAFGAWVIARLAGWSGYRSQSPAGPMDFFTGLQWFYVTVAGLPAVQPELCIYLKWRHSPRNSQHGLENRPAHGFADGRQARRSAQDLLQAKGRGRKKQDVRSQRCESQTDTSGHVGRKKKTEI